MIYHNPENVPAVRQHARGNPTTCPWCGERKWFVSDFDDPRDNGRVQMYCDSSNCVARETELIIVRGEGANMRADARALRKIDDGHQAGDAPSPASVNISDPKTHDRIRHKREHRIAWRQGDAPFTIQPAELEDEV